jgi:hypothetical protein
MLTENLSQLEEFVKMCCSHRAQGGKFVFLGVDAALLNGIEDLHTKWDVEYYDEYFPKNLWATYKDYSIDLVYIHSVDKTRDLIDSVYEWGPKVRGGGALAGSGYQNSQVRRKLLERLGDCPTRWPDIWALPIVGFGSAAETQEK